MSEPFLCESVKPTRTHYKILLMSWAGWVFDFYDLVLFTFLLIPIGNEFGFSQTELSYLMGTSLAATAIGGIIFGVIADKIGRKLTLQLTILTYSIGTFCSGFASSLWVFLIFRIITGLGVGGEWATGQTYVGETFPPKNRGRYCAFMQTGAPLGIALASVVGGLLAPGIGWRYCFFISVIPALLVVFIRRHLPESDLWHFQQQKGTVKKTVKHKNKISELLSPAYRKIFILALVLAIFDMTAYWLTYSWMPGYLHHERNFTMTKSAIWILVTQSGGFVGYFFFGFIADRLGRRPAYSIYSVIMAAGLLMITVFWKNIEMYPSIILGFMFLVGFGTGMFGGYGSLFAELFPTHIRSTAMGTAFNLARGIQFFTPVIIATIAIRYGLGGGIALASLFALLTGIWIWTFPETKGKKLHPE
ncbi:MAG: MFS transporter [Lentimicrobiaceae bacterium]|nr:MFS transporter [Lentimicrobiaceae bacterium]